MSTQVFQRTGRFIGALLLGVAVTATAQVQVTLDASKDNTLFENATGSLSNGAGDNFFVGRTNQASGSIRRGLIAFNIAGSLPNNATVTSVTLRLNMSRTISGNQTVTLRRVTADWGEGTSNAGGQEGTGAPATTNDATWLHRFFNTSLWSSAGGSFAATPSASQTVGTLDFYTWGSSPDMVSDVQQWLNNPSSNFGWVIMGNETAGATSKRFDSKENPAAALRPKLTVTYTIPNSVEENSPYTFALHQNYPNPFNPSTHIRFSIASRNGRGGESEKVSLKVFDVLGREVATLVDALLPAGSHSVQWNAADFSTGVYVSRLEAGGFVATRKLVLAR